MNGGGGYTPDEVGNMTLDQIWFRLCDADVLKKSVGNRTEKVDSVGALMKLKPDEAGLYKGRAVDGSKIKGRIGGKSKARQLMEQEAARIAKEKKSKKRRKRPVFQK